MDSIAHEDFPEKRDVSLAVAEAGTTDNLLVTGDTSSATGFRPFEIIPQEGTGRISAIDIPPRYNRNLSIDAVLDKTVNAIVGRSGLADMHGLDDSYSVNSSRLSPNGIEFALFEWEAHKDQIYSMSFANARLLDISALEQVICYVTQRGVFRYLIDLNLSYTQLSKNALDSLCSFVNPIISGYCPVRRLTLTHCYLSPTGVTALCEALTENVVIEELSLSGNRMDDSCLPALNKFLSYPTNILTFLSLGDNKLTADGMKEFSQAVKRHNSLRELQLNSNKIGDVGADYIFEAIRDKEDFNSLNLNRSEIKDCRWAGRLRVITCLSSLYLSYNVIDDSGLQTLSGGLSVSACLRYLDISYNIFGGGPAVGGVADIIRKNKILTTLVLAGNCMIPSTWTVIASSLAENFSLLRLDCTHCELTLLSAEALCRALEINEVCTIDMRYNDLPEVLLRDPRSYTKDIGKQGEIKPKPLVKNAQAVSLKASQQYRRKRLNEIRENKKAFQIVQEQEVMAMQAPAAAVAGGRSLHDGLSLAGTLFQDSATIASATSVGGGMDTGADTVSQYRLQQGDAESFVPSSALSLSAFGPPSAAPSVAPSGETVNISTGAHRARALHRFLKRDTTHAESIGGKRILTVAYGRMSTILGKINVTEVTSYAEAKELIKPLVKAYCGGETSQRILPDMSAGTGAEKGAGKGITGSVDQEQGRAFSRGPTSVGAEADAGADTSDTKPRVRSRVSSNAASPSQSPKAGIHKSASTGAYLAQTPIPSPSPTRLRLLKLDSQGQHTGSDTEDPEYRYQTSRPLRDYAEEFTLFRPDGHPVDSIKAKLLPIWVEASVNNYTVLVRPAGWIDLKSDPSEYAEDSVAGSLTQRSVDTSLRSADYHIHNES